MKRSSRIRTVVSSIRHFMPLPLAVNASTGARRALQWLTPFWRGQNKISGHDVQLFIGNSPERINSLFKGAVLGYHDALAHQPQLVSGYIVYGRSAWPSAVPHTSYQKNLCALLPLQFIISSRRSLLTTIHIGTTMVTTASSPETFLFIWLPKHCKLDSGALEHMSMFKQWLVALKWPLLWKWPKGKLGIVLLISAI